MDPQVYGAMLAELQDEVRSEEEDRMDPAKLEENIHLIQQVDIALHLHISIPSISISIPSHLSPSCLSVCVCGFTFLCFVATGGQEAGQESPEPELRSVTHDFEWPPDHDGECR